MTGHINQYQSSLVFRVLTICIRNLTEYHVKCSNCFKWSVGGGCNCPEFCWGVLENNPLKRWGESDGGVGGHTTAIRALIWSRCSILQNTLYCHFSIYQILILDVCKTLCHLLQPPANLTCHRHFDFQDNFFLKSLSWIIIITSLFITTVHLFIFECTIQQSNKQIEADKIILSLKKLSFWIRTLSCGFYKQNGRFSIRWWLQSGFSLFLIFLR